MEKLTSAADTGDWQPTCSLEILQLRSAMLIAARRFFTSRFYLEVETPLLSQDVVVDAHIEPFEVLGDNSDGVKEDQPQRWFLQTSPEAAMKRLVAAGSGSIFQITRSFRRNERGHRHNSEFTLIEWYGVGTTFHDQMQLTQELIHFIIDEVKVSSDLSGGPLLHQPFQQVTYEDCFLRSLGCRVFDLTADQLSELIRIRTKLDPELTCGNRDNLLNMLLAECIEPQLGATQPEFLTHYPASQAALAEPDPCDGRTALRFELYANGIELCNGYQELLDAAELQRRDQAQNQNRSDRGSLSLPGARRMLEAIISGLPKCSGVALGFDRLVMVLAGLNHINQALPFPTDRA